MKSNFKYFLPHHSHTIFSETDMIIKTTSTLLRIPVSLYYVINMTDMWLIDCSLFYTFSLIFHAYSRREQNNDQMVGSQTVKSTGTFWMPPENEKMFDRDRIVSCKDYLQMYGPLSYCFASIERDTFFGCISEWFVWWIRSLPDFLCHQYATKHFGGLLRVPSEI